MYENNKESQLGKMIKLLLEEHSLSMRKLSLLTGIDTSTISRIISGKQHATINHIQKLSQSLQVPIEQLISAAGYKMGPFQQELNSETNSVVDTIQEILKSSNVLDDKHIKERIEEELSKYEQYALTDEGKGMIFKGFDEKINKISSVGPFIDQLNQMYKEFCDDNISTKQRAVLGSGLLYFIFSTDIIPDYIFPIGYVDDVIALKLVQNRLLQIKKNDTHEVPPAV